MEPPTPQRRPLTLTGALPYGLVEVDGAVRPADHYLGDGGTEEPWRASIQPGTELEFWADEWVVAVAVREKRDVVPGVFCFERWADARHLGYRHRDSAALARAGTHLPPVPDEERSARVAAAAELAALKARAAALDLPRAELWRGLKQRPHDLKGWWDGLATAQAAGPDGGAAALEADPSLDAVVYPVEFRDALDGRCRLLLAVEVLDADHPGLRLQKLDGYRMQSGVLPIDGRLDLDRPVALDSTNRLEFTPGRYRATLATCRDPAVYEAIGMDGSIAAVVEAIGMDGSIEAVGACVWWMPFYGAVRVSLARHDWRVVDRHDWRLAPATPEIVREAFDEPPADQMNRILGCLVWWERRQWAPSDGVVWEVRFDPGPIDLAPADAVLRVRGRATVTVTGAMCEEFSGFAFDGDVEGPLVGPLGWGRAETPVTFRLATLGGQARVDAMERTPEWADVARRAGVARSL